MSHDPDYDAGQPPHYYGPEPLSDLEKQAKREEADLSAALAAFRIFQILDRWMTNDENAGFYTVRRCSSGRFELDIRTERGGPHLFYGETLQDAYGQAAQTINFNGGSL